MPDLISGQPQGADNAVLASQANDLLNAPAQSAQETAGAESQAPAAPVLPEKYRDKSSADLAKMHSELESRLGEQGRELGELRNQYQQSLWQLQNVQQQALQQRPKAPEPEPESTGSFWDNPTASVSKQVRSELKRELGEVMGGFQRQQALAVGELAFDAAKSRRPDLFSGVENEVRGLVQQGVMNGWLAPDSVTKPETYQMAAWQMQGLKKGFAFSPSAVNPVQPSFSETPSAASPPANSGQPIAFDDEARKMIRGMGYKEEDIAKDMRERSRGRG